MTRDDALFHAGRMAAAVDRWCAAMQTPRYRTAGPDPDAAGRALADLLTAKRDYDRACVAALTTPEPRT